MVDKNRLVAALLLKNDNSTHHYSWGQQLDKEVLHSIEIPELGNLHVPLAIEDVEKLKSIAEPALHGNGLNVVLDPNLRKGWQVMGMKISGLFPKDFLQKTLGELCTKALLNLKLGWLLEDCDSNTVDAYIDKLVLYESGGHYKRHHHSELEQGICGVMILQIPVENGFNGGRLKIEHRSSMAHYDCHEGSNHFHFLTAFRSGCKQELESIKSGWRVTLMINLVWRNAFDVTKIPQSIQPILGILELLTELRESVDPWFKRIHRTKHGNPVIEKSELYDIPHTSETTSDVVEQLSELINKTQISNNVEAASHRRHEEFNDEFSFSSPFEVKITNIARFHQRNLEWQQSADFDDGESGCDIDTHWKHQRESIDMLVFLLENDYTLTDLTFFGLKGQDVWLARLLLGGNFLEVHLAILNHSRLQGPFGENPSIAAKMEHWVNSRNMLVPFKNVLITANQIVSDFKTKSHHRTDQEEIEEKNMNFPKLAYQEPVLVIWPKYQSFRIKCLYAFDILLDELEHELQTTSHQKSMENLRRIISACRDEPLAVFLDSAGVPGERTCRLLRLCILLRARQEGLDLLELMGMDFANEDACEENKEVCFEGIRSNEVALLVAELECQVTGWSACSGFVLKMISPVRLSSQLAHIICLAGHLMDRYCTEGALKILDRVAYLLPKLNTSSISSLGQTDIDSYVNFVIECERDAKTASAQRVVCFTTLFPRLDSYQQCRLIVDLRRRIRFGGIPSCMQLYQQMCRALPSCDLHAPGPIKNEIVAVVSSFFQLGDPELILLLMNKICLKSTCSNQSDEENNLVDVLLLSHEIWELATSSDLGKTMLSNLVKAQTSSLLCMLDQLVIPRQEIVSAWHIREMELVPNFNAKTSLLESLSQLELTSDNSKLIRDARLAMIVAWIDGLCQQLDRETPVVTPHPTDSLQLNVTEFLKTFIQMEKAHNQDSRQPMSVDFSPLFSKMCLKRLCHLILDLRQTDSASSTDVKVISSCFNLYRDLSRQFVEGDIISFMKPSAELAVKIAKWLFWLGDEVALEKFAYKICNCVSLEEENIFVKEIISSSKLWSLANSEPASLSAFHALLDRHIGYLKTVKEPVFSLEQPLAELPMYPEVEAFLRSSEEKMSYHKLASIFHARGFADDLTKLCLKNGWCSLKARAMGSTRSAWCEIIKTQDMHRANIQQFRAVQQELSKMLSLRENLGHQVFGGKDDVGKLSDFTTVSENCISFLSEKCEKKEPEIIVISD